MLNTQSLGLLVSGIAISGFGIFSQQPLLAGAGAGVAGSISSTNLVSSRRKDAAGRIDRERDYAAQSRRIQALESIIGNFNHRIELNHTTITDTQVSIDRLQSTSKTHGTHLNLLTKGHQQLQQLNHSQRSTIVTQATVISDKDRELADLQSELDRVYSLIDESQPASNPVTATEPVTHLLIDGNAMRFIEKEFGNIDYQILKDKLTQGATKVKCNFYVAETGKPGQKEFITELKNIGFKIFFFPIVNYAGGIQKTKGDDVQIAIDAVNAVPGDRVILCGGGDSDFFPVVNRLKDKGINFTVVAHQSTLGNRLKRAAGQNLIYFSAIANIKLS